MSEKQEIEIGKLLHPKILAQYGGEYDNPSLRAYVDDLGNQLAEKSHRAGLIYHFTVLDSPQINAFALPGGYIYITRGILAYMGSEAELMSVIGHEIGHVAARHGVKQHTKGVFASMLAILAAQATGSGYAGDLANLASLAIIRGYGRKNELQADKLGAEYTARSSRDPRKMLAVLKTLKSQEDFEVQLAKEQNRQPNVYHGLFTTHPEKDMRLQEFVNAATQLEGVEFLPEDEEVFLGRIEGVTFGPSEKEGVTKGASFYHRDLDITFAFPQGWLIDNKPAYVQGRNTSDTSLIVFTVEDRNFRNQTPHEFLKSKSGKKNLPGKELSIAGLDGYTALTEIRTPYGTKQGRVSVLFADKKAYLFRAASRTEEGFQALEPLFFETVGSLRRLTEEDVDALQQPTIRLVRVKPEDTFASLAKESAFSSHAEEQLRLLNGMYPDGKLQPGQLIKTVR